MGRRLSLVARAILVFGLQSGLAVASGEWTWAGGSDRVAESPVYGSYGTLGSSSAANVPGARYGSSSWTDAIGALWLFGGLGRSELDTGRLNDLWKYEPGVGRWTWMKGATYPDNSGWYGVLGIPAALNSPGARQHAVTWTDASGALWLFGGYGSVSSGTGYLNDLWKYDVSLGQWAWTGGSKTRNQVGTYGTPGSPAAGNVPGGRYGAVSWTDADGNRWLFGGRGYAASGSGYLNDLWKLDVSLGQWAWMGGSSAPEQVGTYGTLGSPAPQNAPGARQYAVSWTDAGGDLWLFGGFGWSAGAQGLLNDLWKYDVSLGQWAWMGGSSAPEQAGAYGTLGSPAAGNVPGARTGPVSFTDADGSLWLFGGQGCTASGTGYLNDFWKYDPVLGQWAWMGGSSVPDRAGTYGTIGTPSAANMPGARRDSVPWRDAGGNLWLFGGQGYTSVGEGNYLGQYVLNDLWKFDESLGQWSWMSGSNAPARVGSYGALGIPAAGNVPGARHSSVPWTDASGNLWLFGGWGWSATLEGYLNDVWKYDEALGQWAWMGGSSGPDQVGTYGTRGIPAAGNVPGARYGSVSWTDAGGNLWLFGGTGRSASSSGKLNDFWKYDATLGQWAWMGGSDAPSQSGTYGSPGIPAAGNVPGGRQGAVSWTDVDGNFWLFGGDGWASNGAGRLNDLWKYDRTLGQWTWMGGSNTRNQTGTYGTLGSPGAGNVPGARIGSVSWTGPGGKLWLFGGSGYSASALGDLNDLWVYDVTLGQWAWMGGSNAPDQYGSHGTPGRPSAGNVPGARWGHVSWKDAGGSLWLFGGLGRSASGSGYLNDLWRYDPTLGQWAWMGGSNGPEQVGTYGTPGTPAPTNVPGARRNPVPWMDPSGHLRLFGGWGYGATALGGHLADLWVYDTAVTPPAPSTSGASRCGPGSVAVSASGAGAGRDYKWYDAAAGGALLQTNGASFVTPSVSVTTTYWASVYDATTFFESLRAPATASVRPLPSANVTAPASVCPGSAGNTASVPEAGEGSTYDWQLTGGAITAGLGTREIVFAAGASGTVGFNVTVTGANGCAAHAGATTQIAARPAASVQGSATICPGQSVSIRADLTGTGPWDLVWSDGTTQSGVAASPARRLVRPSGTVIWTVTSLSDARCSAEPSDLTGAAVVTVDSVGGVAPEIAVPGPLDPLTPGWVASVPPDPGATYLWTIENGSITAGQGTAQITFLSGVVGTLRLTVAETMAGGCTTAVGRAETPVSSTAAGARFHALTPCRIVDTRTAQGPYGGPSLAAGVNRSFEVGGQCGVPSGARAVAVNVTVVPAGKSGTLTIWPGSSESVAPGTWALAFGSAKTRANNGTYGLIEGTLSARLNQEAGTADLIVDVSGYFD